MKVIVGLGNPGSEYAGTRHNIGREIAEKIARHIKMEPFGENKKLLGQSTKGNVAGQRTFVLLPDTYMNKSGTALAAFSAKPKDLVVIHDDTDIPLGVVKISFGRNSAGHKGVESVMRALKSKDFWRIRIGVQPRPTSGGKKKRVDAMDIVLKKWTPAEKLVLKKLEKKILKTLEKPLFVTTLKID